MTLPGQLSYGSEAPSTSLAGLRSRVSAGPFVAGDVVSPGIIEIAPGMAEDRLRFLLS